MRGRGSATGSQLFTGALPANRVFVKKKNFFDRRTWNGGAYRNATRPRTKHAAYFRSVIFGRRGARAGHARRAGGKMGYDSFT